MSDLDRAVLAEKTSVIERHLERVEERLPSNDAELARSPDASDAVILHLWQAVQIAIDLALSFCLRLNLGAPSSYADAFRKLNGAGVIEKDLAERLVRAAGFRNVVAHAYESIDMQRVYRAASEGPIDLRAFLAALRDRV